MELHIWPSDFGLPTIDVSSLQFLVRKSYSIEQNPLKIGKMFRPAQKCAQALFEWSNQPVRGEVLMESSQWSRKSMETQNQ
ncbi:hypothetical protein B9Z55_003852 [Caenorhabditis nigoni]|uniref:Uncharacterized protein n=1 Tax=Caenorhabditis nigoni TaxID=1611254 RepID=A0A2G5VSS3_9PELO|nr:hypothetical protein B9Z55_003852 [Caenorhabditis nigoni]